MRRMRAGVVVVLLLAGGCSSADDDQASPTTRATRDSGPSTTTPECRGVQPATEAALTWVSGGYVFDGAGCIVEQTGDGGLSWGGKGDRVLAGASVVVEGGDPVAAPAGRALSLSRPTGTSVLAVTAEGRLLKKELATGTEQDISFMARHESAVYHPAGRHIVSTGQDETGSPALVIAGNLGQDPRPILEVEEATAIGNPAFTASGALLYTAVHADRVDLHRLVLGEDQFSTVASVPRPGTIDHVVTSPFEGGGVAWNQGTCSATRSPTLRVTRGGTFLDLKGTDAEFATPVGWLPDGSLAVLTTCQPGAAGTLLRVSGGDVEQIATNTASAAVRAVLPPPPPPPANLPAQGLA